MRWSCVRSILIAVATLTCGSSALADEFVIQASPPAPDAATDVVVTIGDPPSAIDATTTNAPGFELPAVHIDPTDAAPSAGRDIGHVDFAPATPAATVAVHPAASAPANSDDLFVDPATGLMIPRFANPGGIRGSATSRTRPSARRHPAPTYGRLHVDPVTGLMIPDFGASTFPAVAPPVAATGRNVNRTRRPSASVTTTSLPGHLHIDPATGLMIPNGMEMPHGASTF